MLAVAEGQKGWPDDFAGKSFRVHIGPQNARRDILPTAEHILTDFSDVCIGRAPSTLQLGQELTPYSARRILPQARTTGLVPHCFEVLETAIARTLRSILMFLRRFCVVGLGGRAVIDLVELGCVVVVAVRLLVPYLQDLLEALDQILRLVDLGRAIT